MTIMTKRSIGFIIFFLSFKSCVTDNTKREKMILAPNETITQIVLRTEGKHISSLDLSVRGEVSGSGRLSIGENDSVFYKTYEVKNGQNEITYFGDWYSEFCYVTFTPTIETKGQFNLEADFGGD